MICDRVLTVMSAHKLQFQYKKAFNKGEEWLFHRISEVHLELCQTSMMESFCKNFQLIKNTSECPYAFELVGV